MCVRGGNGEKGWEKELGKRKYCVYEYLLEQNTTSRLDSFPRGPKGARTLARWTHPPTPYSARVVPALLGSNAQCRWYTWLCPEKLAVTYS